LQSEYHISTTLKRSCAYQGSIRNKNYSISTEWNKFKWWGQSPEHHNLKQGEGSRNITCSTRWTPEATTDPLRRSWIFSINQSSKASPIPSCKICLATQKAFRLYCTQDIHRKKINKITSGTQSKKNVRLRWKEYKFSNYLIHPPSWTWKITSTRSNMGTLKFGGTHCIEEFYINQNQDVIKHIII